MKIQSTLLPGVLLIEPKVIPDSRGTFQEMFQEERYRRAGIKERFVQDNFSRSCRGTLRGMHYQIDRPQGKLVQAIRGELFDVAVDLRQDSPTFGQWQGVYLSDVNHRQLYIPPGLAHGFCVVSETADFYYKCTDYYQPHLEQTLLWNDPQVAIDWPLDDPLLSEKDRLGLPFDQVPYYEAITRRGRPRREALPDRACAPAGPLA